MRPAAPAGNDAKKLGEPLNKDQYQIVRDLMYRKELTSHDMARETGFAISEVNSALVAENYHQYRAQRHAKSASSKE